MLKDLNCVITITNSSKRQKRKEKFVPVQAVQAYRSVQVQVHSFFKAQHWMEMSG
jgi:hypothetical protein